MSDDFRLRRVERLRGKRELEELFAQGRRGYSGVLRYFWLATPLNGGALAGTQSPSSSVEGGVQSLEPSADRASSKEGGSTTAVKLPAVLFSVPKRCFKRANKRNLMKRRMRESYRLNKGVLLQTAADKGLYVKIGFVYNKPETFEYKYIEKDVRGALDRICKSL